MPDSHSQGSKGEGSESRHAGQDLDYAGSEWEVETQTQGFEDQPLESSSQNTRVHRGRTPPRPSLLTWAFSENKKGQMKTRGNWSDEDLAKAIACYDLG